MLPIRPIDDNFQFDVIGVMKKTYPFGEVNPGIIKGAHGGVSRGVCRLGLGVKEPIFGLFLQRRKLDEKIGRTRF